MGYLLRPLGWDPSEGGSYQGCVNGALGLAYDKRVHSRLPKLPSDKTFHINLHTMPLCLTEVIGSGRLS